MNDKSIKISDKIKKEIEQYSGDTGIIQKRIIEDGWKLYKKDRGIKHHKGAK